MTDQKRYTLREAADMAGINYSTIRVHAHRKTIVVEKEGRNIYVDADELDRYIAANVLEEAVAATRAGAPMPEIGNVIRRLPPTIINAILDGLPTSKKPGSPEPFLKALQGVETHTIVDLVEPEGPHWGRPVGYVHIDTPCWKRTSGNRWSLGDAWWDWNGFGWEGGGSRAGMSLGDGVSPAHPASDQRPLSPPSVVRK